MAILGSLLDEINLFYSYQELKIKKKFFGNFSDYKKNLIINKVIQAGMKKEDGKRLTNAELNLNFYSHVFETNNEEYILSMLKIILDVVKERIGNKAFYLVEDYFDFFSNWNKIVYTGEDNPKFKWNYKLDVNNEGKCYTFELRTRNRLVMVLEVKTTLSGNLVGFETKYSEFISKMRVQNFDYSMKPVNFGTKVLRFESPLDGDAFAYDATYNLDLLVEDNYSDEVKNDNCLEWGKVNLSSLSDTNKRL